MTEPTSDSPIDTPGTGTPGTGTPGTGQVPLDQRTELIVNLDGLDLPTVDRLLRTEYKDPVRSRLLEAARAFLVLRTAEIADQMEDAWHIDIHSDW